MPSTESELIKSTEKTEKRRDSIGLTIRLWHTENWENFVAVYSSKISTANVAKWTKEIRRMTFFFNSVKRDKLMLSLFYCNNCSNNVLKKNNCLISTLVHRITIWFTKKEILLLLFYSYLEVPTNEIGIG